MNKILLDQQIIVKGLYLLKEFVSEKSNFINDEEKMRLPELTEQEMLKLIILEKELGKK